METIKELLALGTAVIQLAAAVVLLKSSKKGGIPLPFWGAQLNIAYPIFKKYVNC